MFESNKIKQIVFNMLVDVKKANREAAEKYLQEIFSKDKIPSEEVLEKEWDEMNRLIDQGTEISGSFKEVKVDE